MKIKNMPYFFGGTMKTKNFSIKIISIVLILLAVIIICRCVFQQVHKGPIETEHEIPVTFEDGFVSKLKLPDNTWFVEETALENRPHVLTFESESAYKIVLQFYDEYFSTLQTVYSTESSTNEDKYYYDESQRMIYSNFNVYNWGDTVRFMIDYEKCEDINNNEQWTTKKP